MEHIPYERYEDAYDDFNEPQAPPIKPECAALRNYEVDFCGYLFYVTALKAQLNKYIHMDELGEETSDDMPFSRAAVYALLEGQEASIRFLTALENTDRNINGPADDLRQYIYAIVRAMMDYRDAIGLPSLGGRAVYDYGGNHCGDAQPHEGAGAKIGAAVSGAQLR